MPAHVFKVLIFLYSIIFFVGKQQTQCGIQWISLINHCDWWLISLFKVWSHTEYSLYKCSDVPSIKTMILTFKSQPDAKPRDKNKVFWLNSAEISFFIAISQIFKAFFLYLFQFFIVRNKFLLCSVKQCCTIFENDEVLVVTWSDFTTNTENKMFNLW